MVASSKPPTLSANCLVMKKPLAAVGEDQAATRVLTLGLTGQKYVFTSDRTALAAMLRATEGHVFPTVRDAATLREFISVSKELVAKVCQFSVKTSGSDTTATVTRKRKEASCDTKSADESYYSCFLVRKLLIHELVHGSEAHAIDWSTVTLQDLKSLCPDQTNSLDTIPDDWSAEAVSNLFFGRSDWGVFLSAYGCLLHEICERDRGSIYTLIY